MPLLLHELLHLSLGLIIGLLFYFKYKNWRLILLSVIVSMFLDVDHYIDFLLANNFSNWNLLAIFNTNYFQPSNKVYVLFHSWEYAIILFAISWKFRFKNWSIYVLVTSMAMFGHLLIDQFSYSGTPLAYLIIWRAVNGFSLDKFF